MSESPRFTVFTPTRNRASTLPRVFQSLCNQTTRDFEWLIVDNESEDGTQALVEGWKQQADFPVRYVYQANRGLTNSWNRGVQEARGEFFVTLASDDTCYPHALARLEELWESIPPAERSGFSGVTTLCVDHANRLIGQPFPRSPLDVPAIEMRLRYGVKGEKWGFQRTALMREHPFPVIDGYLGYIPEGLVWNEIGRRYKERFVNEVLRQFWRDAPVSLARPRFAGDNALGAVMKAEDQLSHDLRYFRYVPKEFLLTASRYSRFSFHLGRGVREQASRLPNLQARLLWAAMLPFGLLRYAWDLRRWRERRPTRFTPTAGA